MKKPRTSPYSKLPPLILANEAGIVIRFDAEAMLKHVKEIGETYANLAARSRNESEPDLLERLPVQIDETLLQRLRSAGIPTLMT